MLILFGGLFLFTETAGVLFAPLGLHVGWGTLWPFIICGRVRFLAAHHYLVGCARQSRWAGHPGTIIITNGLILLYQNLTAIGIAGRTMGLSRSR
jgi:hypothetical protein